MKLQAKNYSKKLGNDIILRVMPFLDLMQTTSHEDRKKMKNTLAARFGLLFGRLEIVFLLLFICFIPMILVNIVELIL